MLIKSQTADFEYRVEKLRELSAMGGFPIEREVAERAVLKAQSASLPDFAELTRQAAARIAAGPTYHFKQ